MRNEELTANGNDHDHENLFGTQEDRETARKDNKKKLR